MKTSTLVAYMLIGVAIAVAIALVVVLGLQARTQVTGGATACPITTDDNDGDCVPNSLDYYPDDQNR